MEESCVRCQVILSREEASFGLKLCNKCYDIARCSICFAVLSTRDKSHPSASLQCASCRARNTLPCPSCGHHRAREEYVTLHQECILCHSARTGARVALSFLTLNTYLVHPLLLSKQEQATCKDHQRRAQGIGALAKQYDLVHLQEVWGPSTSAIQEALAPTHSLAGCLSTGLDLLDTAKFFLCQSGGLWSAFSHRLHILFKDARRFTFSNTRSGKGFSVALLKVKHSSLYADKVLALNMHLDPTNDNQAQLRQLGEVHQYLVEWVEEWKGLVDFSKVVVLLSGDFNIESGSELYGCVVEMFGAGDVYGDFVMEGKGVARNSYSRRENPLVFWDAEVRIDFIWNVRVFDARKVILLEPEFEVVGGDGVVVEFGGIQVEGSDVVSYKPGEELSDHYAVIALLNI